LETLVIDYLKRHYTISLHPEKNYDVFSSEIKNYFYVVKSHDNIIYWNDLSKELVTIFGINEELAKFCVGKWAYENKCDLLVYFNCSPLFPSFDTAFARTIVFDLVPVQPLSEPNLSLHYLDFKYEEVWYLKLKNKFIKFYFEIKEKISTFVKKLYDERNN
jgi:hypothetical protein